jgi:hypothetical protein
MLDYLRKVVERLSRPSGLGTSIDWQSMMVDYERPLVERLWLQHGENRIYLHKIYPLNKSLGEKAYMHIHRWPSAMKILKGVYEMEIGELHGPTSRIILTPGSEYEMTDPNTAHNVSPLGGKPVFSIMVTGSVYPNMDIPKKEIPSDKNQPLSAYAARRLITEFEKILYKEYSEELWDFTAVSDDDDGE